MSDFNTWVKGWFGHEGVPGPDRLGILSALKDAYEAGAREHQSETLDQMRAKPYLGPFLQIQATIGMSGDNALSHAGIIRELIAEIHRLQTPVAAKVNAALRDRAEADASELERIGKLAKAREVRERV